MKERKSTHHSNPGLYFLLSISEQLWPAKGFNFRWEIEFCRDMICIRTRFRVSCVVCMQTCVSVRVQHKDHVIRVWQEGIYVEKLYSVGDQEACMGLMPQVYGSEVPEGVFFCLCCYYFFFFFFVAPKPTHVYNSSHSHHAYGQIKVPFGCNMMVL